MAPLTNAGVDQLRVSLAHELFHAIQIGAGRGRLPEWLAESTAVWMEGIVVPPDVDREIYRVALGGAGTEEPYWQGGDLHEYGAWWLIEQLERAHPGFVRRLLALAATRGDDDPDGLRLARARARRPARASSRPSCASRARRSTIPLVGRALRPGAPRACGRAGGSCCARACRRSACGSGACRRTAAAVTRHRAAARSGSASCVRRGSLEQRAAARALRAARGRAGVGAGARRSAAPAVAQGVRLTLTRAEFVTWVPQAPIWGIFTVGVATCRNLHMLVLCLQNNRF